MNMQRQAQCASDERLQAFLDERLQPEAEAMVAEHIGLCESCRVRMERLAGDFAAWDEVQRQLRSQGDSLSGVERDRESELHSLVESLDSSDDPNMLGRIGRYEVLGLVGRGSAGIVVKAFEPQLNRYVAIKMLAPSFRGNGPARVRFEREAKAIAAVKHEHVVPVHAVDEHRGLPYMVMQYASGGSLQQRINERGPLDTCEIVRIGLQIARGLAEAHKQGIVHRDVKPANVMLEDGVDRAMVSDFGLARVADEAAMTCSGLVAGTPQYMSPEQASGLAVDPRSDLFSLGSTLYAACTGHSPFRAESVFGVIKKVCESEPRPVREVNPRIEPWFAQFIERLHDKDRSGRFESADEVVEILGGELAFLQNPTTVAVPARTWLPRKADTTRNLVIASAAAVLIAVLLIVTEWPLSLARGGEGAAGERAAREASVGGLFADGAASTTSLVQSTEGFGDPPGKAGEFVAVYKDFAGDVINGYSIYLPLGYDTHEDEHYPVILNLGGGCSVGGPIEDAVCWGLPETMNESLERVQEVAAMFETEFKLAEPTRLLLDTFVVVSPHMKEGSFQQRQYFDQERAIEQVLDEIAKDYRTDSRRVYVTGAGRGGHGAWGLASRLPERFAAVVPLRGMNFGISSYEALADIPVWVGHCTGDKEVDFAESAEAVAKIEALDGRKFLHIGKDDADGTDYLTHKRLFTTYESKELPDLYGNVHLFRWLLKQRIETSTERQWR